MFGYFKRKKRESVCETILTLQNLLASVPPPELQKLIAEKLEILVKEL